MTEYIKRLREAKINSLENQRNQICISMGFSGLTEEAQQVLDDVDLQLTLLRMNIDTNIPPSDIGVIVKTKKET